MIIVLAEQISEFLCCLALIYFFGNGTFTKKWCKYLVVLFLFAVAAYLEYQYKDSVLIECIQIVLQPGSIIILLTGNMKERSKYAIISYSVLELTDMICMVFLLRSVEVRYDFVWNILLIVLVVGGLLRSRKAGARSAWRLSFRSCVIVLTGAFFLAGLLMFYDLFGKGKTSEIHLLDLIIFFVAASYLTLIVTLQISEKLRCRKEEEVELLESYKKLQTTYYENLKTNTANLRSFKHETNKHFAFIRKMLQKNQLDAAVEYLDKFSDRFEVLEKLKAYSDNPVVDAILNDMVPKFEHNRIELTIDYTVYGEYRMDEVDLSTILYNLLQNALEATRDLQQASKAVVLMIHNHEKNLVISVKNPCNDDENRHNVQNKHTGKRDSENHGFGIRNIEACAEKYQGQLDYDWSEEEVCATVILFDAVKQM